ncbi:MAG: DUF559 domain-containing protein [Solirubrobacteraceae bacterium]
MEFAIGLTADVQRGVVTRQQLLACGLTTDAIDRRRKRGWLRVLHRGVYAVGHIALPELGRETAAVLACGDGALLSHHSATALWGLTPARGAEADIDVTVPGRNPGFRRGIRIHRVAALDRRDIRRHRGLPVVAPARALLDAAPELAMRELERALGEALAQSRLTEAELADALARHPRWRGLPALRRLLQTARDPAITRSEAEARFLALVGRAGLCRPGVNVPIGPYVVDFLWRAEQVIVEIDGFSFHRTRRSFEADRRRDVELRAAGYTVLRFTWRQLLDEHELVLVRLGQVMPLSLRVRAG